MSAPDPPARHGPREFWLIAQAFLLTLHNLFGAPEDVAAQHTLVTKAHKLLASWLAAGEALLRKLLLIEAAAIAPAPPPLRQSSARARKRVACEFDAGAPENWRVSFRVFLDRRNPRRRDAGGPRENAPLAAVRFRSARPLAERYEALLRVFNDPSAAAKRLARRLRVRPEIAARLLAEPPDYASRVGNSAPLRAAAEAALARFDSS